MARSVRDLARLFLVQSGYKAHQAHFEIVRGDAGAARRDAEIVVQLSQENAMTNFTAWGALQSAWASARLDGRETGASELDRR